MVLWLYLTSFHVSSPPTENIKALMFWILDPLVSRGFLLACKFWGPYVSVIKKTESGAGESGFFCAVCCIDWYIKIPPIIVCQDLVRHLVTDFAIRYLCCPCTLKNPANLGRTLLLSHLKDLFWLMGTEDFALTPVFQSHGNLWHALPQMPCLWYFFLQHGLCAFPQIPLECCYAVGYSFPVAFWYLFPLVGALPSSKA